MKAQGQANAGNITLEQYSSRTHDVKSLLKKLTENIDRPKCLVILLSQEKLVRDYSTISSDDASI